MKIHVIPKDIPLDKGTVVEAIEISSTEGFNEGDIIQVGDKLFRVIWVEPMPKELHPALQLLIKFLFIIGVFAACILAFGLSAFILSIIIGAIRAIFNYPT